MLNQLGESQKAPGNYKSQQYDSIEYSLTYILRRVFNNSLLGTFYNDTHEIMLQQNSEWHSRGWLHVDDLCHTSQPLYTLESIFLMK